MARTLSREEVERRAYEIYEARGHEQGHALDHWLQAEQECSRRGSSEGERRTAVAQGSSRSFGTSRS